MKDTIRPFTWARRSEVGYEVSSKGDKRFSAFNAVLFDGRTIEQHYQCDVKGYDIGGTNWRLGKGKPSLKEVNLFDEYLSLWGLWAKDNIPLMRVLYIAAKEKGYTLTDCFATTEVNQAHALSIILNNLVLNGKP